MKITSFPVLICAGSCDKKEKLFQRVASPLMRYFPAINLPTRQSHEG
jgi:hypothetical protein